MTKYISFKIFDTKDHPDNWDAIKQKQIDKYYTIVHEDYFEKVIQSELDNMGKCQYCGGKIYDEPHYDCEAEHNMIRAKEDRADMEEAMNHEPDYDEVFDEDPYEEEAQND